MATNLSLLVPEFKALVEKGLELCSDSGLEMRPICAIRTPQEQAKLWRQSRSLEEIRIKLSVLRMGEADFLADCIERVGPQNGPQVTKALPGFSWHQWGEAVDCMWIINGKAEWNDLTGYKKYAEIMRSVGIKPGADFNDFPHIQFRKQEISSLFTLKQIDAAMKEKFG